MHFTVLVVDYDHESALAPFQENNMGDCPEEYLQFISTREEWKEMYTEKCRFYRDKETGEIHDIYSEKAKRLCSEKEYAAWDKAKSRSPNDKGETNYYVIDPESQGLEIIEGTEELRYPTFQAYLEAEADDWDEEHQDYGYIENPNAKWDGYQLGGRWAGFFMLKKGVVPSEKNYGEKSWTLIENPYDKKNDRFVCDRALIGEIDWEGMHKRNIENVKQDWINHVAIHLQVPTEEEWLEIRKNWRLESTPLEEFKELYNNQKEDLFGVPLGATMEEYFETQDCSVSVYAVLLNGEWLEGLDAKIALQDLIENGPKDQMVSLVDCHI